MFTLRKTMSALCLATSLAGLTAYAAIAAPATTSAPTDSPAVQGQCYHHGRHGGMLFVLHKLDLTAEQKSQVKSIFAGEKSQFEALRSSAKANRQALAATPPTDPGYPALIQTAQTNAATRIKLESETWSAVYSGVLTKQQQQAIPGIVAAAEQARAAREAEWKSQHAAAEAPAEE